MIQLNGVSRHAPKEERGKLTDVRNRGTAKILVCVGEGNVMEGVCDSSMSVEVEASNTPNKTLSPISVTLERKADTGSRLRRESRLKLDQSIANPKEEESGREGRACLDEERENLGLGSCCYIAIDTRLTPPGLRRKEKNMGG